MKAHCFFITYKRKKSIVFLYFRAMRRCLLCCVFNTSFYFWFNVCLVFSWSRQITFYTLKPRSSHFFRKSKAVFTLFCYVSKLLHFPRNRRSFLNLLNFLYRFYQIDCLALFTDHTTLNINGFFLPIIVNIKIVFMFTEIRIFWSKGISWAFWLEEILRFLMLVLIYLSFYLLLYSAKPCLIFGEALTRTCFFKLRKS